MGIELTLAAWEATELNRGLCFARSESTANAVDSSASGWQARVVIDTIPVSGYQTTAEV